MSLTKCPACHRLTFIDASSCPSCEEAFRPGTLRAKAAAEERGFNRRCGTMFLSALLLAAVAASLFAIFRT
jgi:ribosomal protein L32